MNVISDVTIYFKLNFTHRVLKKQQQQQKPFDSLSIGK